MNNFLTNIEEYIKKVEVEAAIHRIRTYDVLEMPFDLKYLRP
jgi:hypothetical protein